MEKARFINEGEDGHTLPSHTAAIHIDIKVIRIEVNDGAVRIEHEALTAGGESGGTPCREHSQ